MLTRTPILLLMATLILACPAIAAEPRTDTKPAPQRDADQGKPLFDGKTHAGWKAPKSGGEGKVYVKDGTIVMDRGDSMTGIVWTGKPPKTNFEITLEGMRLEGNDFFCTTTFPVGDGDCSFVAGGWGGGVIGLSCVDHNDASENATSRFHEFKNQQWYKLRVRVTDAKIEVWLDGKQVVDQERKDHQFNVRLECDDYRPLGICTWNTKGAVRNIRLRELKASEIQEAKQKE